jgi:hypothetical protein
VIKNPVHSSPLNLKTKMTSLEVKRDDWLISVDTTEAPALLFKVLINGPAKPV